MSKSLEVPFEQIDCDLDFNARKDYNLDTMVVSLKDFGLLNPIGVHKKPDGRYALVDGFRRYLSIAKLRETYPHAFATVSATLRDGTKDTLQAINLIENMERENLQPHEYDLAIVKLMNCGHSQDEIANRLGRSQAWVSSHLKTGTRLTLAARKAYAEGNFNHKQALLLAALPEDTQTEILEDLLELKQNDGAPAVTKKLRQVCKKTIAKPSRKPKNGLTKSRQRHLISDYYGRTQGPTVSKEERAFWNGATAILLALQENDASKADDLDPTNTYLTKSYTSKP